MLCPLATLMVCKRHWEQPDQMDSLGTIGATVVMTLLASAGEHATKLAHLLGKLAHHPIAVSARLMKRHLAACNEVAGGNPDSSGSCCAELGSTDSFEQVLKVGLGKHQVLVGIGGRVRALRARGGSSSSSLERTCAF